MKIIAIIILIITLGMSMQHIIQYRFSRLMVRYGECSIGCQLAAAMRVLIIAATVDWFPLQHTSTIASAERSISLLDTNTIL